MSKLTTINISLPEKLHDDVKSFTKVQSYSSVSEVIRDALRRMIYSPSSQNEIPRYLEDATIRAEKEPLDKDVVLNTDQDIEHFFLKDHS